MKKTTVCILFLSISFSAFAQDITEVQKTRVRTLVKEYCKLLSDYSKSEANINLRSQIENLFPGEYNTTTVFDDLKTNQPIQLRDYLDIIRNDYKNSLTFTFNNIETAPILTAYLSKHPTTKFAQIEIQKEIRQLNKTVKNVIIINLNDYKIWGISKEYEPFYALPSSEPTPNAPTNVSARVSGSSVIVSWSAVSGATHYVVHWSNSATGNYQFDGTSTSTIYTDNSPIIGNNYYRVSAVNSSRKESIQSSSASVNFPSPPPDTPTPTTGVKSAFGIKAGMNLSTISNNTSEIDFSPKIKIGFNAGILLNLRFGRQETYSWRPSILGLQPELLYSHQGFVINDNAINFNYITFPLMIKFNLGNSSYAGNFNFEFGPFFSYLITVTPNSLDIITDEYDFFAKALDVNISDLKNGKDVGVVIGVGYEFYSGLVIGARYNHGLSDMAKNLMWKNSVVAVSVGWKF